VTEKDLEAVALVFGAVKALRGGSRLPREEDKRLTDLFDAHLTSVMTGLAQSLGPLASLPLRENAILAHKVALYDVCFSQLAELASLIKPELGTVVLKLRAVHAELFSLYGGVVRGSAEVSATQLAATRAQLAEAQAQAARYREDVEALKQGVTALEAEVGRARGQAVTAGKSRELEISRLAAENAALALRVHRVEAELAAAAVAQAQAQAQAHTQGALAAAVVAAHSSAGGSSSSSSTGGGAGGTPDRGTTGARGARAGAAAGGQSSSSSSSSSSVAAVAGSATTTASGRPPSGPSPPPSPVDVFSGAIHAHAHAHARGGAGEASSSSSAVPVRGSAARGGLALSSSSHHPAPSSSASSVVSSSASAAAAAHSTSTSTPVVKVFPLKQLKLDMELLYASKAKGDALVPVHRVPRETLEQHMYTWLKNRHGNFPRMIADHASTIIRSTNAYAGIDNDVRVFGKILRNEVDEEFRLVQRQLKEAAVELLRVHVKAAHPLKTDGVIADLVAQRTHPTTGVVVEEEWAHLVGYLYEPADAEQLTARVREALLRAAVAAEVGIPLRQSLTARAIAGEAVDAENSPSAAAAAAEAAVTAALAGMAPTDADALVRATNPRGRMPWSELLQTLLDFQLAGHEKFLLKFRRIFRDFDTQRTGVVTTQQFQLLVAVVAPGTSPSEVARLVAGVDPYGCDRVTFSTCVAAMTRDLSAGGAGTNSAAAATAPRARSGTEEDGDGEGADGGDGGGGGGGHGAGENLLEDGGAGGDGEGVTFERPENGGAGETEADDAALAAALSAPPPPPPPPTALPRSRGNVVGPTVTVAQAPPAAKMVVTSSLRPGGGKVLMSSS
jgi:hypothetical protein